MSSSVMVGDSHGSMGTLTFVAALTSPAMARCSLKICRVACTFFASEARHYVQGASMSTQTRGQLDALCSKLGICMSACRRCL